MVGQGCGGGTRGAKACKELGFEYASDMRIEAARSVMMVVLVLRALVTVVRSLSPRPDRLTTMVAPWWVVVAAWSA
jgi:hypothetical protein